jgi:hypothetical protein
LVSVRPRPLAWLLVSPPITQFTFKSLKTQ